jgi:hypothetical protein
MTSWIAGHERCSSTDVSGCALAVLLPFVFARATGCERRDVCFDRGTELSPPTPGYER